MGEYQAKAHWQVARRIKQAVALGLDPWDITTSSTLIDPKGDIRTCLRVTGGSRSGTTLTLDLSLPEDSTEVVEDTTTLPAATVTGIVKGVTRTDGTGTVTAVAVTNPSPGIYKLAITLSDAAAGTVRGGVDTVDATTEDRSSAWMNFKAPSSVPSIAVPSLHLDNWLLPFEIDFA
jgi:hypothetical protein